MTSDTINIYIAKNRTGGFTTVRAFQTINFLKQFFMLRMKKLIQVLAFSPIQKKFFILLLIVLPTFKIFS